METGEAILVRRSLLYCLTHNFPSEFISSVSFGLSVETVADDAFIVHDEDTPEADVTNDGVQEIVVYAKHEAGEGTDQDFGFWHPKLDGEPLGDLFTADRPRFELPVGRYKVLEDQFTHLGKFDLF